MQTTKEKAIHLLREKNYQLEVRNEELQKAKNEVKNFKSHLQEALKKIKQLEREKPQTIPSQLNIKEEPTDIVDLRKIANDFDVRLAQRKEEKTLHYLQEW